MRRKTWPSMAALCACLLFTVALADRLADDALQPNFLPSSAAKNSLGGIFVEEQATAHATAQAEEGSAAKLLAEIEAQDASASVVEDDGPPAISHSDAESLTHTLMAALRGADPTQAFHEMMASNAASAVAQAAAPQEQEQEQPQAQEPESPSLPSFLQQKESASAARIASMVGNKRVEVEDDKAEDISKDDEDKEAEEEEHPDPYGLHHAADTPQAAAPASAASWPNYFGPAMFAQQNTDAAANDRFKQQMVYNPYSLYAAYFQQFAQATQHHKHHRHHHRETEEDANADKPESPSSSSTGDAMRFKEKGHPASHDEDDDGDVDDDDDDGDADDDGDGDDDDDDGDDEERRRRERKRKEEQKKLKYDDGMNKMRFEQTQVNLDIENMKSFTSPRQSGYSAPVDSTPVSTPSTPAAIPLAPSSQFRPLFNGPAQPQAFQPAPFPQAVANPGAAPAYPSLLAISSQTMPTTPSVQPNSNGIPMPYFPPTSAPPPAPNQVPVAAQTVNGVYPPSMVMPSTAAMPFAADGMVQSPAVNPSAPTMNPNAPAAPGLSNYPFGGTSFLELESVPLPSSAIHAHVDAIARHPRHPHIRSRLTQQHFEEFPLIQ